MDKGKIEEKAIGVLRSMVDDHPIMEENIHHHDKYMSWDGTITVYKNADGNRTKENLMDSVPVQVKGHINKKYVDKEFLKLPVSMRDLRVYYRTRGCVYFQIALNNNEGEKKSVYCATLYPSKLKTLIEIADKNHIKNPSVKFNRIDDCFELDRILKQFLYEIKMQGLGEGQIVPRTVYLENVHSIQKIEFHSVYDNEKDIMKHIVNGDICLYAVLESGIKIPLEWMEGIELYSFKIISRNVYIDGEMFYSSYKIKRTIDDEYSIVVGACITLDLKKRKFVFVPAGSIDDVYRDSLFFRGLLDAEEVRFGDYKMSVRDITLGTGDYDFLNYFIKIGEIFRDLNFCPEINVSDMSEQIKQEIHVLYQLATGAFDDRLNAESNIYNWFLDGMAIPLIVRKRVGEDNIIEPALYNKKYALFLNDNSKPRIPTISAIDKTNYLKLFKYDLKWFDYDLKSATLNDETKDYFNDAGLKLILVFDVTNERGFLDLAEWVFNKLLDISAEPFVLLNLMQVLLRKRELGYKEMKRIDEIKEDNSTVSFAKSVLLKDLKKAKQEYDRLGVDEKKQIEGYPIVTLYNKLLNENY